MFPCPDAHIFCQACVRTHISTLIGQGKVEFPCLNPECDAGYPVETLKPLLKQAQFSRLLQRCAAQAVMTAEIPNLVQCPFCDFATIMDNPNDRVFTCLNPECSRESCRLCKEPNHVPLRCEEVEKESEIRARTLVEEKMSEALMRECWQCKKKLIKDEGCNKLTCPCGAKMCYLCREPVKDYSHFSDNDPNKCPVWTDSRIVHAKDVASAATQAKEELKSKGQAANLKYDPTQDLPSAPPDVLAREEARRREQQEFERRFQELSRNFRAQGARALEGVDEALGLAAGPVPQPGLRLQARGNVRAHLQRPPHTTVGLPFLTPFTSLLWRLLWSFRIRSESHLCVQLARNTSVCEQQLLQCEVKVTADLWMTQRSARIDLWEQGCGVVREFGNSDASSQDESEMPPQPVVPKTLQLPPNAILIRRFRINIAPPPNAPMLKHRCSPMPAGLTSLRLTVAPIDLVKSEKDVKFLETPEPKRMSSRWLQEEKEDEQVPDPNTRTFESGYTYSSKSVVPTRITTYDGPSVSPPERRSIENDRRFEFDTARSSTQRTAYK
ncbi:unnamed protein product [Cyprideis torosa]|uniref:Uncharacterized protein n=1 Tax=Cyprideis torosa TaxID=163714 RepID=A0A7R8WBG6_9CRUS|nr:unnamed protein product [Cyprideis torosa]CAG0889581.1 unnamed protein product [Cyprideis torosa]